MSRLPDTTDETTHCPMVMTLYEARNVAGSSIGGKAASVVELASIPGIDSCKGFIVSTQAFQDHIGSLDVSRLLEQLKDLSQRWAGLSVGSREQAEVENDLEKICDELQREILAGTLDAACYDTIQRFYAQMRATPDDEDVRVAVRSSATAEDTPDATFAGQYETLLNRKGCEQVIAGIMQVWASTYNFNSVNYRNKNNISHCDVKMAVLIMEMVDAYVAGTAFTIDPQTGASMFRLDQTYGLGELNVSGNVSPDSWVIDPNGFVVVNHRLGKKRFRVEYDPISAATVKRENSVQAQERFALDSVQTRMIAMKIKTIHDHYVASKPNIKALDIEYAVTADGRIVFLQARPETVVSKGKLKLVMVDPVRARAANLQMVPLEGMTGSPGVVTGTIRIVRSVEEAAKQIRSDDILVAPETTNVWERPMGLAVGMITEEGSPSSHTAVVAREQGKPAIVACTHAMSLLKPYEGQIVTIDAMFRRLYGGRIPDDFLVHVSSMPTEYGTKDVESVSAHYRRAERAGQAYKEAGRRWLCRKDERFSVCLKTLYEHSFIWVAEELGLSKMRGQYVGERFRLLFEDLHRCREEIRDKSLDWHEQVCRQRLEAIQRYLQLSRLLTLTPQAVREWLKAYVEINGFLDIGFNLQKVLEGLLEHEFQSVKISEPYLSLARASMAALFGETLTTEALRSYKELLNRLQEQTSDAEYLRAALHDLAQEGLCPTALSEGGPFFDYYVQLKTHAVNYTIRDHFALDFMEPIPLRELAQALLQDWKEDRKVTISHPTPENYYPDSPDFQRVARLTFLSAKLRQDTHHLLVRGQWHFMTVIRPLGELLIREGVIIEQRDLFDHEPQWLLEQLNRYEADLLIAQSRSQNLCLIKPYQISPLAAQSR